MKSLPKNILGNTAWNYASWYRDRFGLLPASGALIKAVVNRELVAAPNLLTGGVVYLRPDTSDLDVYEEIFIKDEYGTELSNPTVIVDAGAHIGLASAAFASRYPDATIIALEPEPENYKVLQANARLYPNIHPVCAGLWNKRTHLHIQDTSVDTWSFRVVEDPSATGIAAIDIFSLMQDFGLKRIDVLKIDIEGSEVEVLKHSAPWIDSVDTLIIELHDRFRPGCAEALEDAVRGFDYSKSFSIESIVFKNLQRVADPASSSRGSPPDLPPENTQA